VPTYDYQCRSCGTVTEVIHSMLDAGPTACAQCGGELRRVLYPAGIIFKGSGFYRTDSRTKDSSTTSTSGGSSSSSSDGGTGSSDGKKGDGTAGGDGAGSATSQSKAPTPETKT
jgi:putative FmdB family regulatory protein